ncbi:MAG: tRNA (adenosine(37)-N6)-threonylcarbamoyltransferase complex ATPase subunit type 1 TsaE [Flammeovirgaceae bacterium]|nr:MAG: tRNA (adenosine(37)-N6)-threonylcarbamoyltransferase complex ATPase subunit type 1 TsaE [Flammeovirgaceae bacterium]
MRPVEKTLVFRNIKLADLDRVAKAVLQAAREWRVFTFTGELGTGKTTFIKAMGNVLGVVSVMSSPTFSIVNEYELKDGTRFLHFDFYRIASEAEAAELGVEEYFDSGDYCFIEWPDRITSLLPDRYVNIRIAVQPDNQRQLEFSIHGGEKKERI